MSRTDLAHTALTVIQEALTIAQLPGAVSLGRALDKAAERRKSAIVDVLFGELAKGLEGGVVFSDGDADELVQMLLRFVKAVETGAAKRNLRLLAQVIVGLKRNQALEFDNFQKWANVLENLNRNEILVLGFASTISQSLDPKEFWGALRDRCAPTFTTAETWRIASALMRTGTIVPDSEFSGMTLTVSPALYELANLARLQDVDD